MTVTGKVCALVKWNKLVEKQKHLLKVSCTEREATFKNVFFHVITNFEHVFVNRNIRGTTLLLLLLATKTCN